MVTGSGQQESGTTMTEGGHGVAIDGMNKPFNSLSSNKEHLTHYEVLGVPSDATLDEIKAAHRLLARTYHPDKTILDTNTTGAISSSFQRMQVAWECLRHEESKRKYDETLKQALSKHQGAIPIELSEMELGNDDDGATVHIYSCRCGDEVVLWEEDLQVKSGAIVVECPGCSFAYSVSKESIK